MKLTTRATAVALAGTLSATAWAVSGGISVSAADGPPAAQQVTKVEPGQHKPLRILLTNDDGWNSPGITAAYEALTAAGHDVTLVAPKTNQSGMSAAMPDAQMHVEQPTSDPHVYDVDSTPGNAMDVGMLAILDERPDLVVSGINSGGNTGGFIGLSGTVGAAVDARAIYGVPGIAISLEQESDDKSDYVAAAQLLVDIVDHGTDSIEDGTVLNVNYPELDAGRAAPTDVVYTEPSNAVPYVWDYTLDDDGSAHLTYALADLPASGDIAELAKDKVTLTLIRTSAGGLGVPAAKANGVRTLARDLD